MFFFFLSLVRVLNLFRETRIFFKMFSKFYFFFIFCLIRNNIVILLNLLCEKKKGWFFWLDLLVPFMIMTCTFGSHEYFMRRMVCVLCREFILSFSREWKVGL